LFWKKSREFKYYQIPWPFQLVGDLSEQEWKEIVNWTNYKGTWDLVYKATRDGFQASEFHHHCNNKDQLSLLLKQPMEMYLVDFL
jgi:hypothetical protein